MRGPGCGRQEAGRSCCIPPCLRLNQRLDSRPRRGRFANMARLFSSIYRFTASGSRRPAAESEMQRTRLRTRDGVSGVNEAGLVCSRTARGGCPVEVSRCSPSRALRRWIVPTAGRAGEHDDGVPALHQEVGVACRRPRTTSPTWPRTRTCCRRSPRGGCGCGGSRPMFLNMRTPAHARAPTRPRPGARRATGGRDLGAGAGAGPPAARGRSSSPSAPSTQANLPVLSSRTFAMGVLRWSGSGA